MSKKTFFVSFVIFCMTFTCLANENFRIGNDGGIEIFLLGTQKWQSFDASKSQFLQNPKDLRQIELKSDYDQFIQNQASKMFKIDQGKTQMFIQGSNRWENFDSNSAKFINTATPTNRQKFLMEAYRHFCTQSSTLTSNTKSGLTKIQNSAQISSSIPACTQQQAVLSSTPVKTSPNRTITFNMSGGPKSWLVDYNGPYNVPKRQPHVEVVGYTPTSGQVATLTNLHVIPIKNSSDEALVWDVVGVTNRTFGAHFTVYVGPNAKAQINNYR